jgi:LPS export ABC transporter protein LptC
MPHTLLGLDRHIQTHRWICLSIGSIKIALSTTPRNSVGLAHPTGVLWVACVFLLILQGIACNKEKDELTQPTDGAPQQTLERFSTSHAEAGVTKWTLIGDSAKFRNDVIQVQNPTVQIFEEGEVAITITGDRGEIIRTNNNIEVFDNVVGVSQDGKLYTDELHWLNLEGKLFAPNESTLVRGDSTMIGKEMDGNPTLEVVTMKDVKFKLYSKDKKNESEKLSL